MLNKTPGQCRLRGTANAHLKKQGQLNNDSQNLFCTDQESLCKMQTTISERHKYNTSYLLVISPLWYS